MIKNSTVWNKKDMVTINKDSMFKRKSVYVGLLICVLMICFAVYEIVCGIGEGISAPSTLYEYAWAVGVPVIYVLFTFWYPCSIASRQIKNPLFQYPRVTQFEENNVLGYLDGKDMSANNTMEYKLLTGYFEKNDAIYIRALIGKSNSYFILHNDSYVEGSREEAISFLESKGVHKVK